jgi:hypothetical protein
MKNYRDIERHRIRTGARSEPIGFRTGRGYWPLKVYFLRAELTEETQALNEPMGFTGKRRDTM